MSENPILDKLKGSGVFEDLLKDLTNTIMENDIKGVQLNVPGGCWRFIEGDNEPPSADLAVKTCMMILDALPLKQVALPAHLSVRDYSKYKIDVRDYPIGGTGSKLVRLLTSGPIIES